MNLTTLMVPVDAVRKCAKEHHVSVTELLAAAMMKAICELQAEQTPRRRHRKPGKACRVVVPDDQLSLAIGKEGQNARLAARLTGYKIDIRPASQADADEPETPAELPAEPEEA